MQEYKDLLSNIINVGTKRDERTGAGAISIFGTRMKFNLNLYGPGFPLVTTKFVSLKTVFYELQWMLRGSSNVEELHNNGVTIWDEWADEHGELGPVYGVQWRHWHKCGIGEIDQIAQVMKSLKENPYSRRHIVSAWNVADLGQMALPPCHMTMQFFVRPSLFGENSGRPYLSCQVYQRSVDSFLGLPYNIASYALLTLMMAKILDYTAQDLIWVGGDTHIYLNHLDQVNTLLDRKPKTLPWVDITLREGVTDPAQFEWEDIHLRDYQYHPAIKAPIAV